MVPGGFEPLLHKTIGWGSLPLLWWNRCGVSVSPSLPPDLPNGSPNYQNATALIVSFTVNNHLDDTQNQMAKIWEKAFLDYVKDPNITFFTNMTFMAEVSFFLFLFTCTHYQSSLLCCEALLGDLWVPVRGGIVSWRNSGQISCIRVAWVA